MLASKGAPFTLSLSAAGLYNVVGVVLLQFLLLSSITDKHMHEEEQRDQEPLTQTDQQLLQK